MIRTILFDLDETLYAPESGVMGQIRILMLRYLRERLGLSQDEAEAMRRHYLQVHGTTMRGLQINHNIDAEEFLHFVHDIPLDEYLKPNQELGLVLASIPQDKVIFTNASREHAEKVLEQLGVSSHFARIVDIRDLDYESKPQPSAYRRVCEQLRVDPEECVLVEDNLPNLRPAKALGMVTVLVRDGHHTPEEGVDVIIERIEEIGAVIKQLVEERATDTVILHSADQNGPRGAARPGVRHS